MGLSWCLWLRGSSDPPLITDRLRDVHHVTPPLTTDWKGLGLHNRQPSQQWEVRVTDILPACVHAGSPIHIRQCILEDCWLPLESQFIFSKFFFFHGFHGDCLVSRLLWNLCPLYPNKGKLISVDHLILLCLQVHLKPIKHVVIS